VAASERRRLDRRRHRKPESVRQAVGEDSKICIDPHGKTTPVMAVDFCSRAEEYRPYFVEETTQLEDLEELAHPQSKTRIPLAGERLLTEYAFAPICQRHPVDYIQPDDCTAAASWE
jgi:galactonate dehydratase